MLTVPDTTTGLKPELIVVVDKIYRQMCNLQAGTQVLIITDSRTPRHVVTVFMGMAMAMGAVVSVSENHLAPPPADQPGYRWNPMLVAAARQADLIIDFAVGYADFMAEAIERGARILSPGDGTGGHHIEDSLIRTMLGVDLEQMRREAVHIGGLFTDARQLRMTSEEGTDFTLDIDGLQGVASHEFLWDYDKNQKIVDWSALPPAAPGLVLPKFSGEGVVAVDGFFLYSDVHQFPSSPVLLTFERGRIVKIAGRRSIVGLPPDSMARYHRRRHGPPGARSLQCRPQPPRAPHGTSRNSRRFVARWSWESATAACSPGCGPQADRSTLSPPMFIGISSSCVPPSHSTATSFVRRVSWLISPR